MLRRTLATFSLCSVFELSSRVFAFRVVREATVCDRAYVLGKVWGERELGCVGHC